MSILNFWQKRTILNLTLLPLTVIWITLGKLRKLFSHPYKSSSFIICVGNINIGGAGKTPTCLCLGDYLNKAGFKVAFLTKGYKGSIKKPTLLNNNHSPKEAGDEPLLLAQLLPTCVSKKYPEGAKYLEKLGYNIIIMDDGYQNPTIIKDYNLLIIDGKFGFGNKLLLPSGPLRESISKGIKKANSIVVINSPSESFMPQYFNSIQKDVFYGSYKVKDNSIAKKNVYAFCGIALPQKFLDTLVDMQANVVNIKYFPDHYLYKENDLQEILTSARMHNALAVTTAKDYIKISPKFKDNIIPINIDLVIKNHDILLNNITKKIKETKEQS